jgi:acetyltransferase
LTKNEDNIIDLFFNPKSIAVIGASKNPAKGGHRIHQNLVSNGYKGIIYPVNPNADGEVFGASFVNSVLDIDDPVDLAIFYIGNRLIPGVLKDCVKKNVKACLIQAAGFEEVGEHGLALRDQIREITDNFTKLRIVGPNCMGISRIDGDSDSD